MMDAATNLAFFSEYREHVHLFKTQGALYSAQLSQLPTEKVLLVFDYSTIHETAIFKLKDLNFTAYWRDSSGDIAHTFFDFWSESKKDYLFTVKAFYTLLDLPFLKQFNELILWSDGGLKTKEILYYFSQLSQNFRLPMLINYFAPHHGHSICDTHFGHGKKKLRQVVGVNVLEVTQQAISSFSSIKNTFPGLDLGKIDLVLPHVTAMPEGIRKWFQFYVNKTGTIWYRNDWEGSWEFQQIAPIDEAEETRKRIEKQSLNQNDPPEKWTVPQLKAKLVAASIIIPQKAVKADLISLYKHYFEQSTEI
jgi:hypothetical protein